MELNDYQQKAMTTCMDTCENETYMLLNLVGEVGEFASRVAKHVRKGEAGIGTGDTPNRLFFTAKANFLTDRVALRKEAGDILWQLAGLCKVMGWDLEAVAQENLALKVGEPTELDPRQEGEALWPERHSKEELLAAKALDPVQFECLYQGSPTSAEGLLYGPFKTYVAKLAERAKNGTIAGNGDGVTKEERNA